MLDAAVTEKARKAAKDFRAKQGAGVFPPTSWITITNITPGGVFCVVPTAGNLWVFYEYGNAQAQDIYVWHQGGSTTPINLGENNVQVGVEDMLVYVLANPATDEIKLGYQIT